MKIFGLSWRFYENLGIFVKIFQKQIDKNLKICYFKFSVSVFLELRNSITLCVLRKENKNEEKFDEFDCFGFGWSCVWDAIRAV